MANRVRDLTGQTFGRLLVHDQAGRAPSGHVAWRCRCECGNEIIAPGHRLTTGGVRSCGCLAFEERSARSKEQKGRANGRWTGDDVTYSGAHQRTTRARGPASRHVCVDCGTRAEDWSYAHACPLEREGAVGPYLAPYCPRGHEHTDCYVPRCKPCHKTYDLKEIA